MRVLGAFLQRLQPGARTLRVRRMKTARAYRVRQLSFRRFRLGARRRVRGGEQAGQVFG